MKTLRLLACLGLGFGTAQVMGCGGQVDDSPATPAPGGASAGSGTGGGTAKGGSTGTGATGGTSAGGTGAAGKGGASTGGSGTAGSGIAGSGTAGSGTAGSGTAGSGTAGSGTAGSGTAGSGTAGSGTAGSGTAGSGTAGSGTAGSGTAGSGTAGSGGSGQSGTGGSDAGGAGGDSGTGGSGGDTSTGGAGGDSGTGGSGGSTPCTDGAQDGDETGVDCGGPTCGAPCGLGQGCLSGSDCLSAVCNSVTGLCVATTCQDGIVDAGESDVDCGGPCTACGAGGLCTGPMDCASSICQADGTCAASACGDGITQPGEQCDLGAGNADSPALYFTQSGVSHAPKIIQTATSAAVFYGYKAASGHTGLEAAGVSTLFFQRDTTTGILSLGIETGVAGAGAGKFKTVVTTLPMGVSVTVSDDAGELTILGSTATGNWSFNNNTDGGMLSGFPFPGDWSVDVNSSFTSGVAAWQWVDPSIVASFDPANAVTITASTALKSMCRLDCSVPKCGDGILDAGETCDDGNNVDGDGCSADCSALK